MLSLQETQAAIKGEHNLPPRVQQALSELPEFVTRADSPDILKRIFGIRVSPRTLEAWPLPIIKVNGWAMTPTAALLAVAHDKLNSAIAAA
jgi:hypothetical protein